jgi:hypothetical protein
MVDAARETGVLFPLVDGRRSTQTTSRGVFADATRAVAPAVAAGIDAAGNWHQDYVRHMGAVEAAMATSAKHALAIAGDGLESLHRRMVFARGDEEVPISQAMRSPRSEQFRTVTLTGRAVREYQLTVPYRGSILSGDALLRQLDRWVASGVVEPSFAAALGMVVDNPDWMDARDLTVVLVGAAAEMGPLVALLGWGAAVVAVDIRRPDVWEQIAAVAVRSAGRLHAPVAELPTDDTDMTAAGADLLTETPEIRAWLETFDGPLVVGNYAYADGATFVRVAAAADALSADVVANRAGSALAYLASPTDVFAVPQEVVAAAQAGALRGRRGRHVGAPLRLVSAGRLFTPNYRTVVDAEEGVRFGLADSVVPQQGPNYALAKRLQRWRALVARDSVVTSANVAPATRTKSVTKNRVLAAAYAGAASFGVEVFEVETSRALMAALLLHDLRNPKAAARPATELRHPLELFSDGAAHGGLWRLAFEPRSVLPLAALEGLLHRR